MRVTPLDLATVKLPDGHPRATDREVVVRGFAIDHPDGVIVVDTGVGTGHPFIDDLYSPTVVPLTDALSRVGIDERNVSALVNTHLHFDHCGQNHAFPRVPVWVQRAEYVLVDQAQYTVPAWARIDDSRRRLVDGDEILADGVQLLAAPGHTPGHQAVLVEGTDGRTLIGGQCCWNIDEFERGEPTPSDMHSNDWITAGRDSLTRLGALRADTVLLSHDRRPLRRNS